MCAGRQLDLLVTTPMRLVHVIKTGGVSLSQVQSFVLDEADKLLDPKFIDQIDNIMEVRVVAWTTGCRTGGGTNTTYC